MIPLHKPYIAPETIEVLKNLFVTGKLSSQGHFTQLASHALNQLLATEAAILTHSCTHALEMAAHLLNLNLNDEVIVPSYAFSSTANAFLLRGAIVRFADSTEHHPNISIDTVLPLVNKKTRAIVLVHYGGFAVDMDPFIELAQTQKIAIIEDAAQAFGAKYKKQFCGAVGDFGAFSFHDTKWLHCGEGGALLCKKKSDRSVAEMILEKGTNRLAFLNQHAAKYEWHCLGSSYAMSEVQAAILKSQLDHCESLLKQRKKLFSNYNLLLEHLERKGCVKLFVPEAWQDVNGNHFFICLENDKVRDRLSQHLAVKHIQSSFHFLALHKSPLGKKIHQDQPELVNAARFESRLLRLPMYHELQFEQQQFIADRIESFFKG